MTNTPGDPDAPRVQPDPRDRPDGPPAEPAAVTREVPVTGGAAPTRETPVGGVPATEPGPSTAAVPPVDAEPPMPARHLPAPGREVTSGRPGPWDAAVAPFTVPPTRHDNAAPPWSASAPPPQAPAGWPPPGPPGAGDPGEGRRRITVAFVAAGAAVLVAAAVALAFGRLGGTPRPQTGARQTRSAAAVPKLRYRTVERDTGYFEGTVTLVNRGPTPMRSWTLGFTYPGADIHNAWEAVLRRTGENVTIVSAPTAAPIAPGEDFEVRFGGAGRPGMPTGCRLNGAPCSFVR